MISKPQHSRPSALCLLALFASLFALPAGAQKPAATNGQPAQKQSDAQKKPATQKKPDNAKPQDGALSVGPDDRSNATSYPVALLATG